MAQPVLPYERLLAIDERLEHAAARPVIAPDRRSRHVEDQPLWSMAELQELLDEWLVACWLSRRRCSVTDISKRSY